MPDLGNNLNCFMDIYIYIYIDDWFQGSTTLLSSEGLLLCLALMPLLETNLNHLDQERAWVLHHFSKEGHINRENRFNYTALCPFVTAYKQHGHDRGSRGLGGWGKEDDEFGILSSRGLAI